MGARKIPFLDVGSISEDERIKMIASSVKAGGRIAFIVEDGEKASRYMSKLRVRVPEIRELSRTADRPTVGVVLVVVSL